MTTKKAVAKQDEVPAAAPSAADTGSKVVGEGFWVRATREGFFDAFRRPGDLFQVTDEFFSEEWMEKVRSSQVGDASAEQVFRASGRTSIAAPDNPAGDAAVDALVGGNKGAQPGVIKDVGTPEAQKAN